MTVASTTNRKTYTGDDVTTSFATSPVIFYATSDLQVRVTVIATGVSTLLTLNTHYSVSGGSATGATGTVSLAGGSSPHGALLSTEKLVILRVLPLTQASDFVENSNSSAEVVEAAFDKLTDVAQQIQEQADRSIRFASGDVSGSVTEIPDVTTRTGRLLGFDATGLLTTFVLQVGTSLVDLAAAAGSSLIGFIQAGTGAILRTLQAKTRERISVTDFAANGVSGAAVDPTGVLDSTLGIRAAVASLSTGNTLEFPAGSYKITDEIQLFNVNRVRLVGKGTATLVWSALSDATKACLKLKWSSFCSIENLQFAALDGTHKPGFGAYVTSEGAGGSNTTQSNSFLNCGATSCSVTGFQIGKHGVDGDVNVDENKLLNCSATTCGTGFEVSGSNTNNTTIRGGYMIGCTSYGMQIAFGARGVIVDDLLPANNTNCHFKLLKSLSGSVVLRNITAELATVDNCMLLQVDPLAGGVPNFPLLTMENVNCTNNSTVAASKIIDYQGSGSVTLRNCRFGGAISYSGGAGGKLSFNPVNSLTSGDTWLITENVHLYDGAVFDVQTNTGAVYFRWLEIGTATSGSGVLTDTPTIGGVILHEGAPFQVRNLLTFTPVTGITVSSNGYLGRTTYKVVIDKAAWTAAAVQQDLTLCTLPPKTRIVGCYADTTIAYAGLAGTIQLNIYVTAAGDILVQHDVKTATVVKGLLDADMGTGMTRAAQIQGAFIGTNGWTGNLQPIARLVSSVGNLGNGSVTSLTTGSTTIYIMTETQP